MISEEPGCGVVKVLLLTTRSSTVAFKSGPSVGDVIGKENLGASCVTYMYICVYVYCIVRVCSHLTPLLISLLSI